MRHTPLPPEVLASALQDRITETSGKLLESRPVAISGLKWHSRSVTLKLSGSNYWIAEVGDYPYNGFLIVERVEGEVCGWKASIKVFGQVLTSCTASHWQDAMNGCDRTAEKQAKILAPWI